MNRVLRPMTAIAHYVRLNKLSELQRDLALRSIIVFLALVLCGKACADPLYTVGLRGWIVEFFGSHVAILRTLPPTDRVSSTEAGLLLTCDQADRRLRLTLPEPFSKRSMTSLDGTALVQISGPTSEPSAIFRVQVTGTERRVLLLSSPNTRAKDPVLWLARSLAKKPTGLQILLFLDKGTISMGRLTPLHISLSFALRDGAALDAMAAACTRGIDPARD